MHTHHSTRLIQVQGSALLPDSSHAPIWFVEHFMQHVLSPMAKRKSEEVALFNSKVRSMLKDYAHDKEANIVCGVCKEKFIKRSVPEYCTLCRMHIHKFKCFNSVGHLCQPRYRTKSCSLPKNRGSLPLTSNQTLTSITQARQHPSVLDPKFVTNNQLSTRSENRPDELSQPLPMQTKDPIISTCYSSTTSTLQLTNAQPIGPLMSLLNPVAPPFQPSFTNSQATYSRSDDPGVNENGACSLMMDETLSLPSLIIPNSQPVTSQVPKTGASTGARKKVKSTPPVDQKSIELEYTKYALNSAKTTICNLENKLKDLDFRNKILSDRLAGLEEGKRNTIDEDILLNHQNHKSNHSCLSSHCCHAQVSHTSVPPNDFKTVVGLMNDIVKRLDKMAVKFDDICDRVITTKPNSRPATAPTESVPVTMDNANISDMSEISYDNVDYLNCDLPTSQAAFLMQ